MPPNKPSIFVIQPFSKATEGVYEIISSAAAKAGVNVFRSDMIEAGGKIMESILSAIQSASLLIADVTNANPNVMYEIGFAQAQNKPIILIANSSRHVPFDLAGLRILIYDLAAPFESIKTLANLIEHGLKEPQSLIFSQVNEEREKRQNVVVSYSHRDREYLDHC